MLRIYFPGSFSLFLTEKMEKDFSVKNSQNQLSLLEFKHETPISLYR